MTQELPVDVIVSMEGLDQLVRAIRAEDDGKVLRKELAASLRQALKPAAAEARSGIMSMSAVMTESPALRSSIAKRIRPEIKLGGRWTGARVRARKTRGIRDFANAPKRTQRANGWRTQIFGSGVWRVQHGKVQWFDRAMSPNSPAYKKAVAEAMEAMARRIANRTQT